MEYRIKKCKKRTYSGNEIGAKFVIQKKVLFWWADASIKCGYRLGHMDSTPSGLMLDKCYFEFASYGEALVFLDKFLVNPVDEYHKGNRIINVVERHTWNELFVNISYVTEYYARTPCYCTSRTLEGIKDMIDKGFRTR